LPLLNFSDDLTTVARHQISPREREFSSVLSQLKASDRSLLMAMVANTGEEKAADNDGSENSETAPI